MAAPGQFSLYRVAADPQNGRHALARGHQVGIGHTQARPAHRVQRVCHQRLYCNIPVTVAGRKPPGQILSLFCGPLAQLCFGYVCGLLGQRATQCVGRNARRDISHTGTADLCIHAGAKGHGQQHRLRAVFQMLHHVPTPQDACFGKGSRVRFQPDRPGRCRRQQRHGACFQQGHGAVVRFPSGPEIPRCLCCIDRRRFCQHQRLRCTDHPPHLLAFLK